MIDQPRIRADFSDALIGEVETPQEKARARVSMACSTRALFHVSSGRLNFAIHSLFGWLVWALSGAYRLFVAEYNWNIVRMVTVGLAVDDDDWLLIALLLCAVYEAWWTRVAGATSPAVSQVMVTA